MKSWDSSFDHRIDEYIDAFEAAWQAGIAQSLRRFLPPEDHPAYGEIAVELARIDLERHWLLPTKKSIDFYFHEFPVIFQQTPYRTALAFEEFRLRRLAGESVTRQDYADRYGIDTGPWPDLPVGSTREQRAPTDSGWLEDVSQWELASKQKLAAARKRLPSVGEQFLGFELVGILGEGALGRVYLARQGDLSHRFVALKVAVHPSDEPQRLAQLQHTNIVPIYSCHRAGPLQATCMPFLGANTLADVLGTFRAGRLVPRTGHALVSTLVARDSETVIREATQLGAAVGAAQRNPKHSLQLIESMSYLQTVVWLAERIARALSYAHDHGVVHCDLKPANIVLTDDGEPLLVDFHLAAEYADGAATSYVVGGTLPYMAPEHLQAIRHGGRVAPAADVYSTGVLIYEMLTGELPFPNRPGLFDDIVDQLLDDRRDLSVVRTKLTRIASPALTAIVLKSLHPQATDRYRTATELHEDLERQLNHQPLRHLREPSLRERCVKWSRRHPRLSSVTSLTTLAIILLLLIAVGWRSTQRELTRRNAQFALAQLKQSVLQSEAVLTAPEATTRQWREVEHEIRHHLSDFGVLRQPDDRQPEDWRRSALASALKPLERRNLKSTVGRAAALLAIAEARLAVHESNRQRQSEHWRQAERLNKLALDLLENPPPLQAQAARFRLLAHEQPSTNQSLQYKPPTSRTADDDSYLTALELLQCGQYSQAAGILEQLVNQQPRRWSAWFGLGSCYYAAGRFRDAEAAYTTALALFPNSTNAHAYRGLARLKQRKSLAAISDLKTAAAQAPKRDDLWFNLALAQHQHGDSADAIASLDQAVSLNPKLVRAYLLRSQVKQQAGDRDGAQKDRSIALSLTPNDPLSWVARGMAALPSDPRSALHDFQAALKLDPFSPAALQNTATILADYLNQTDEAIPYVTRLAESRPLEPEHLAWRGVLLARLGRRRQAIQDAETAWNMKPSAITTLQIACIYALTSKQRPADQAAAIRLVKRALAQRPLLANLAATDADFTPLRKNPAFRRLIEAAEMLDSPPPNRTD